MAAYFHINYGLTARDKTKHIHETKYPYGAPPRLTIPDCVSIREISNQFHNLNVRKIGVPRIRLAKAYEIEAVQVVVSTMINHQP
jgi:hypothetical protein